MSEQSIEGTVRYMRSDHPKECICCPGEPTHVFAYYIEGDDGKPLDGTGGGWIARSIRRLPDGTRVRLSLQESQKPPETERRFVYPLVQGAHPLTGASRQPPASEPPETEERS